MLVIICVSVLYRSNEVISGKARIYMNRKIFISYKNSVEGKITVDSQMALSLHDALAKVGISSFCAGKTLQQLGADKYKEIIDTELDQCSILIVVGTSLKNMNSRWVKYEWDGFCLDILNGQKNGRVFTYVDGINPHHLPRALRVSQSFDRARDQIEDIVRFIQNALSELDVSTEVPAKQPDAPLRMDACGDALEFSSFFFHSGANRIKDSSMAEIEEEVYKISELYRSIHYAKHYDRRISSESISQTIVDAIREAAEYDDDRKLIKIKGPLGSYKNRLLQYIYLLIERIEKNILPFYIDLAIYEKSIENQVIQDKGQLELLIEGHFSQIKEIISKHPDRRVLIMIDGIRDFSSGRDRIYSRLKRHLSDIRCLQIVSMDTDFTNNSHHKFTVHPLAGTDYEYFIRIVSMSIYNKPGCIEFINKCLDIFHIRIPYANVDAVTIYNRLAKLGITNLDAYWLANLLTEMLGNILNTGMTVSDLYEAICRKSLDPQEIDSAAMLAYQFEYGTIDFSNSDFYFDVRWKVIRKHRSMLDYLIARYYIINLSKINVDDATRTQEQLHFFNMILPKSITSFVSPMINRIEAYENKVLAIAYKCYDDMSIFEKNQLVYWMGRLKSSTSVEESIPLLKKYRQEQYQQHKMRSGDSLSEKKNAFHLRTISVSLMVLGDKKSADEYFDLLLHDKISNTTNRAFHLTYYGDKPYIPNMTMMDFDDDVQKGANTFEVLCLGVQAKLDGRIFGPLMLLELFTLCSLLQARLEAKSLGHEVIPCDRYARKTLRYLKQILRNRKLAEYEPLRNYFTWMCENLTKYYDKGYRYSYASIYNDYSRARETSRTGWVNRSIPNPENIVEHMYNCWLMAAMYLPDQSSEPGYDKQRIMNMLLVHDIGETKTGDIIRPEKQLNRQYYHAKENEAMHDLIFFNTYPMSKDTLFFSECWNEWIHEKSINYLIARDIDIIQGLYQFSCYYLEYAGLIDLSDAQDWFDETYDIKTEEGREILERLVLGNERFADLVKEMEIANEYDEY